MVLYACSHADQLSPSGRSYNEVMPSFHHQ